MSRPLVIYHSPCNDGWCCAWILHRCFRGVELWPAQYGDPPPPVDGKTVIIADFSYPRDVMERMNHEAHRMMVFDHHKSAEEACKGLDFCVFDRSKSGAGLIYQWCRERGYLQNIEDRDVATGMQEIARFVEDRDLFLHRQPWTHEINACLRSYPWELDVWDRLARRIRLNPQEMAIEGEAILRYKRQLIEQHVRHARDVVVDDILVPGVECTVADIISDTVGELAKHKPFAISWCPSSDGQVLVSLRSDTHGEDVSEIAKRFGGGGHARAAGFRIPHSMIGGFNPNGGVIELCSPHVSLGDDS